MTGTATAWASRGRHHEPLDEFVSGEVDDLDVDQSIANTLAWVERRDRGSRVTVEPITASQIRAA